MKKQEANSKVNDLIFKELIKRGYSLEGKTRVWNIADSKLWYLTPEQIEMDEKIDEESIFIADNEEEVNMILAEKMEIKEKITGQPFNLIDLGCSGKKSTSIINLFKTFGIDFRYCPLDINPLMIEKTKRIFDQSFKNDTLVKFNPLVGDFFNLGNSLENLKDSKYRKNIIFMDRNTFVNFEPNELLYNIRLSMHREDTFILTSSIFNDSWIKRVKKYHSGGIVDKFTIQTMLLLGLKSSDLKFLARFSNNRSEIGYVFKNNKIVKLGNREIAFRKGDKIIVLFSYKHKKEDLLTYLNIQFSEADISTSKNNRYLLAICKH